MNRNRTFLDFALLAMAGVMALCSVGCDSPENIAQVSGKVTLGGTPLANALVRFQPAQGSPSAGYTDADGEYMLTYSRSIDGAEIGEHWVSISTYSNGNPDAEPPAPPTPEKVPARYNSNSEIKKTVSKSSNRIDFELEATGPIRPIVDE